MSDKQKFDFDKYRELKVKYKTIIRYIIYLIVILILLFTVFKKGSEAFGF